MEYIKVFNEHSDYETYINNDDKILPNLSYCKDVNDVHLNKVETRIIAKYNIEYSNYGVTLCSPVTNVQEIEINGTKLESVNNGFYRFPKPGEYTVKFKLIDNTSIMNFYSTYGSLTDIIIPKSITYIPPACFLDCTNLSTVKLSVDTSYIGTNAFKNCSSLTNLIIPKSVTTIENSACISTNLTSLEIPDSVIHIYGSAFKNNEHLTEVSIGTGLTWNNLGMNSDINNIFYNTDVSVLSLNCNQITSTNTSDTFNFLYVMKLTASSIKKLVLGDNITSIGKFSFKHLTGLTDLRMSNNVEYLGQECFYNCSKLTEITLPSTLQTIESNAFANCSSLNSITILATTPPELVNINNADVNHIFEGSYPIYVPAESVNTYKTANGWSNYYANRIFAIQ